MKLPSEVLFNVLAYSLGKFQQYYFLVYLSIFVCLYRCEYDSGGA